jgi:hypothetical protein
VKYLRVKIECDSSVLLAVREDSTAMSLYKKWQETDDDDDFEELADWIVSDVKDQMEIYIEDIEEN